MDETIRIERGGRDLLPEIDELWCELRDYHCALNDLVARRLRTKAFADRRADLEVKAGAGDTLLVLLARDEADGALVGYAVATVTETGAGELDSFYVRPSKRGGGLGSAMLAQTMDWMQERAADPVRLAVAVGNEAVLPLYQRAGFFLRHYVMEWAPPGEENPPR